MRIDFGGFYCKSLSMSPKDVKDIKSFKVVHPETGGGLEKYLKEHASDDEAEHLMRTYLVRMSETDECVGYFSLKAGLVSLGERGAGETAVFDTIPGVELANFAVDETFFRKYKAKGIGRFLFSKFILPIIVKASEVIGVRLVYIFALPYENLIKAYNEYGFQRLPKDAETKLHRRLKPEYDQSCIFMYCLL